MSKPLQLLGQKFTRLLVVADAGNDRHNKRQWLCECDCGLLSIVCGSVLKKGATKSCGCFDRESTAERNRLLKRKFTHDEVKSRAVWKAMMRRCYEASETGYHNYGGAGIVVCELWHDFKNFYADMGAPQDGMSIDRIDPSGSYSPENCRWATRQEQNRNKKFHIYLEHNGEKKLLVEWAEELGVEESALRTRKNMGWTDEAILTTPIGPSVADRLVMIEFQGEQMCLKDWARKTGISYGILKDRHAKQWPIDKMLTTPKLGRHPQP